MFNDLTYYASCKRHLTKLSDNNCCPECGDLDAKEIRMDLRCKMIVKDENDEDQIISITVFRKHLEKYINEDLTIEHDEEKVAEILEDKVSCKKCEVHYNSAGSQNNVAVKVKVT